MTRASALLAVLAIGPAAHALGTDRVAVEILGEETPREAALEYERACWRLGADLVGVLPLQVFEAANGRFVRLGVQGGELALRCLEALSPCRRGVDGSIEWFDGFLGGALVPPGEVDRIADVEWYDRDAPRPEAKAPPAGLVERLVSGDIEAQTEAGALALEEALATIDGLARQGGPGALTALERLAEKHPHWRVRRAAAQLLDPSLSFDRLKQLATHDPAWEVRHGALFRLGLVADAALATRGELQDKSSAVVGEALARDPAPEVRRQAIWLLSTALVHRFEPELKRKATLDPDDQVRAAALETLAAADRLERSVARQALKDPSPVVRAVGANVLAVLFDAEDAPTLWQVMLSDERAVRVAAAPMLMHVETEGLGEALWTLYQQEASEMDAQGSFLVVLADALARSKLPGLSRLLATRLDAPLPPGERRLLARTLSKVDSAAALSRFVPGLSSEDPSLRAVAVDAVPDTPETRTRRLELLADESELVRASAVLGLCRIPGMKLTDEQVKQANLAPLGLGGAALNALARCGETSPEPTKLAIDLTREATPARRSDGTWLAVAALVLLIASVVGVKLGRPADAKTTRG